MRTLVYKRTHHGDPDKMGRFGIYDCMGAKRAWRYDAVIGVGGVGAEPRKNGIEGKVNWIGIGPHKAIEGNRRGPVVTFDHFLYFGSDDAEDFMEMAPVLATRMYSRNVRAVLSFSPQEQAEVEKILALATNAPPSPAGASRRGSGGGPAAPKTGRSVKGCST